MYEIIKQELNKYEGLHYKLDEIYEYRNKLNGLSQYGMVLLGPDSFMQNEAINIIEFFQQKNFELIDVRIKQLNRTMTENLFLPTSTCNKCGNLKWWMIQDSANQGAFCAALFYCAAASDEDNCLSKLNSYKGKSNPLNNIAGVVRYDYEAINVCLNLIHIPDTYGDFFKDTSPFYTVSEIIEIIRDRAKMKSQLQNKFFELELLSRTGEKYIFELVLYKTKYRVASLLIGENSLLSYYQKQYDCFKKEKQREKRNMQLRENIMAEEKKIEAIERELLNKIQMESEKIKLYQLLDRINILRLLKLITIPNDFKCYEKDIYMELQGYGIVVNSFEKLILNTSLIQWEN